MSRYRVCNHIVTMRPAIHLLSALLAESLLVLGLEFSVDLCSL
jgi:hypothetical protein